MFINGEWLDGRPTFAVTNPATGETIDTVPDCSEADIDAAIGAAHVAFSGWRATTAYERAQLLYRAWERTNERKRELPWSSPNRGSSRDQVSNIARPCR